MSKTHVVFGAIIALATLNRNTSILLVLAYALLFPRDWRRILVYGALWAAVYGALLLTRHPTYNLGDFAGVLQQNIDPANLIKQTIPNTLAIVPVILLAWLGIRRNVFLRRVAWVMVVYVPLVIIAALWWESRVFLSLFPLLLPGVLIALDKQ